jgi:hypothetical protein
LNPFVEVDEAGSGKYGMSVGVDEARNNYLAATIEFHDILAVLLEPFVALHVAGGSDGGDLAATDKKSAVFDESDFRQSFTTSRPEVSGKMHGHELGNAMEEDGRRDNSSPRLR